MRDGSAGFPFSHTRYCAVFIAQIARTNTNRSSVKSIHQSNGKSRRLINQLRVQLLNVKDGKKMTCEKSSKSLVPNQLGKHEKSTFDVRSSSNQMSDATQRGIVVIRIKELRHRIGLSRATIYNLMSPQSKYFDALFAKSRIKISANTVGFIEADIDAWLKSRMVKTFEGQLK